MAASLRLSHARREVAEQREGSAQGVVDVHGVVLDAIERTPLALNVLPYVPVNPLLVWVLGLDAAAIEFHPGGSTTERTHQLIRVLDQEAVDAFVIIVDDASTGDTPAKIARWAAADSRIRVISHAVNQ